MEQIILEPDFNFTLKNSTLSPSSLKKSRY